MPILKCSEPGCNQLIEASCQNIIVLFGLKQFLQNIKQILPDGEMLQEQADKQLEQVEEDIKNLNIVNEEEHYLQFVSNETTQTGPPTKQKILTLKCLKGHSNIYSIDCPL